MRMTERFYAALETCIQNYPDRYQPCYIELSRQYTPLHIERLCDLDAAFYLIATELYGLRPHFRASHAPHTGHILVFEPGQYNRAEHDPRLAIFFRDVRAARQTMRSVVDVGKNSQGQDILVADQDGDLFDVMRALTETRLFAQATEKKQGNILALFPYYMTALALNWECSPREDAWPPYPVPKGPIPH